VPYYFTLLTRDDGNDNWRIEFGDYSSSTVEDERIDQRDHEIKCSNLKIIRTNNRQADINAAVAALNI